MMVQTVQATAGAPEANGYLRTAYGIVRMRATERGLREVWLPRWRGVAQTSGSANGKAAEMAGDTRTWRIDREGGPQARIHLEQALIELDEYFAGTRRQFAVALDPVGTDFLLQAWRAVADVPYGETRSYGEIAQIVGLPDAARAVGRANAINPLAPFVPCHRIVGSDGRLTGYGPGLPMKERLLRMEDALPDGSDDFDAWITRLRARAGLAAEASLYLGVRRMRTYCLAGCERSRAAADLPARFFTSLESASEAGFAPCPRCQAPASRRVSQPALELKLSGPRC
ncbi:MAG TPA: methylated-DNA--[protein]-cysteine S-methyltransferase [Ktedonobacterales bacterium]